MFARVFLKHSSPVITALALAAALAGCGSDDDEKPKAETPLEEKGPTLPAVAGTCPEMVEGAQQFLGKNVLLHVPPEGAPKGGPMVFYWHGSGSSTGECSLVLGPTLNEITAAGGVVACMDGGQSANQGANTGPFEWYEGDYEVADEVLACATEKFELDSKRIHALGMSAGGLQSSQMVLRRPYMASAVSMSGGCLDCPDPPDPSNKVPMMLFHGSWELDVVLIHFYDMSRNMANKLLERGQFSIDCDHNGAHRPPSEEAPDMWRFFRDHPYKVSPEPYSSALPEGFPEYCNAVTEPLPLYGQ